MAGAFGVPAFFVIALDFGFSAKALAEYRGYRPAGNLILIAEKLWRAAGAFGRLTLQFRVWIFRISRIAIPEAAPGGKQKS